MTKTSRKDNIPVLNSKFSILWALDFGLWARKKPGLSAGLLTFYCVLPLFGFLNVLSLGALWPIYNIEGNPLPLLKGLKTLGLYCREVNEDVRTLVLLDETKTLCLVKPLY